MGLKQSSAFWECRAGDQPIAIKDSGPGGEFETPKIRPLSRPFRCPCCGGEVFRPSLQIVIDDLELPPQQAAILTAVWGAKGSRCPTTRIMDAIWADDPDGGPPPERARLYFKTQLSLLRKRLRGSGVSIETVGFRRGYRLVMGDV